MLLSSLFAIAGCSLSSVTQTSKSFEGEIYYKVISTKKIVYFDLSEEEKQSTSDTQAASAIKYAKENLSYYEFLPWNAIEWGNVKPSLVKTVSVFIFGNTLIPKESNTDSYSGISGSEYEISIHIDSEKIVIQRGGTPSLTTSLYVTKTYAQTNKYNIVTI